MRYVALDIETTGLSFKTHQILSVAMVADLNGLPIDQLPIFNIYINYDYVVGQFDALLMNIETMKMCRISDIKICSLINHMTLWLKEYWGDEPVTFAGKNFGSFDRQFLLKAPGGDQLKMHHRSIDVGTMWMMESDQKIPSFEECKQRAGFADARVSHTALEDALDVVRLIRAKWKNG